MPKTNSRKLGMFMQVSLDGYYCDSSGDMSFAHKPAEGAGKSLLSGLTRRLRAALTTGLANLGLEPSCLTSRVIMFLRHAAQAAR